MQLLLIVKIKPFYFHELDLAQGGSILDSKIVGGLNECSRGRH